MQMLLKVLQGIPNKKYIYHIFSDYETIVQIFMEVKKKLIQIWDREVYAHTISGLLIITVQLLPCILK